MTLDLTIIVPAFNEAGRLGAGMKRFDAAVDDGAIDLDRTEVIVVDDGSTDTTADTARSLLAALPHHRVVRLAANAGKGAAIRAGVRVASGTCTAYMDADMAIDPRSVAPLLAELATHDVVVGSRALPESMVDGTYALRSVMGRVFNRLVTTGTRLGLEDTQCGFKGFRTPVARLLFHLVPIDRFAFDVELLSRARRLGLDVAEIPVQWQHVPGSTVHPLHDSFTMLSDVYRSRLGMVATPPVPAVVVRDPAGGNGAALGARMAAPVRRVLGAAPVPQVADGPDLLTLLPLVDAAQSEAVVAAVRDELAPFPVYRRSLSIDALARLAPLGGSLDPGPDSTDDGPSPNSGHRT